MFLAQTSAFPAASARRFFTPIRMSQQFTSPQGDRSSRRAALVRAAILLAGLATVQFILFGPSLCGSKLLLPLDQLARWHYYLPPTPQFASVQPYDLALCDQVILFEFERRFAAREFRAGRLPLWTPDIYLGAPYAIWGKYAPFNWLYCAFPSPVTLAWMQFLKALLAGGGAYLFFRRVLRIGFWPATIGAWCYPLTGFFMLWQGYPQSEVAAWFPWLLLAVDGLVRHPLGWSGPALAVLTCTILLTRVDVAVQALAACGIFTLWRIWEEYRSGAPVRPLLAAGAAAAAGWLIGCLLAAPYLLPLEEYSHAGERILQRTLGTEERPPGGLGELPRLVLPEIYGATHWGSYLLTGGNLLENGAAASVGFVATMLLVPMAWFSRAHRSSNLFWTLLCLVALGWTLDLPGIVDLLRAPGLKVFSHNRLTFVAAFALLVLTVVGLQVMQQARPFRSWGVIVPVAALVVLGAWCLERSRRVPEPLATQLQAMLQHGRTPSEGIPSMAALEVARAGYVRSQIQGAVLCGIVLCAWLLACWGAARYPGFWWLVAALTLVELLWFGYGRNPQCPPALYYPDLPVLKELAARPGRVLAVDCLPANLPAIKGLHDIRGYDSMDPRGLVELLAAIRDPADVASAYANLLFYRPLLKRPENGEIRLPPILDMLGVRYLLFRGGPPAAIKTVFSGDDYWVIENRRALPRCFVPEQVRNSPEGSKLNRILAASSFDPRKDAYVDGDIRVPTHCEGRAAVVGEIPSRVTVEADMQTPGLLVVSDLWYEGWQAECNGERAPVLRTNGVLRGVVVPAGHSTIVFSYAPASLASGVRLFLAALSFLICWTLLIAWLSRRHGKQDHSSTCRRITSTAS